MFAGASEKKRVSPLRLLALRRMLRVKRYGIVDSVIGQGFSWHTVYAVGAENSHDALRREESIAQVTAA